MRCIGVRTTILLPIQPKTCWSVLLKTVNWSCGTRRQKIKSMPFLYVQVGWWPVRLNPQKENWWRVEGWTICVPFIKLIHRATVKYPMVNQYEHTKNWRRTMDIYRAVDFLTEAVKLSQVQEIPLASCGTSRPHHPCPFLQTTTVMSWVCQWIHKTPTCLSVGLAIQQQRFGTSETRNKNALNNIMVSPEASKGRVGWERVVAVVGGGQAPITKHQFTKHQLHCSRSDFFLFVFFLYFCQATNRTLIQYIFVPPAKCLPRGRTIPHVVCLISDVGKLVNTATIESCVALRPLQLPAVVVCCLQGTMILLVMVGILCINPRVTMKNPVIIVMKWLVHTVMTIVSVAWVLTVLGKRCVLAVGIPIFMSGRRSIQIWSMPFHLKL